MTGTQNKQSKNSKKKEVKREKKAIHKLSKQVARMENSKSPNQSLRNLSARALISREPKERINWYLLTLLDPSRWEEAVAHGVRGIPDFYSHRNHIFCTRTVEDLDTSNFDSDGKCFIKCTPSMIDHLHHTGNMASMTTYKFSTLGSDATAAQHLDYIDSHNKAIQLPSGIENSALVNNAQTRILPTTGNLTCTPGNTACKSLMASNPALVGEPLSTIYHHKIGRAHV